jgi:hypothetical protein
MKISALVFFSLLLFSSAGLCDMWGRNPAEEFVAPPTDDIETPLPPAKQKPSSSELTEFRGIPWGALSQSIPGLHEIERRRLNVREFTREGDAMQLGGAKLQRLIYRFWEDQFYEVSLQAIGAENMRALKDTTFEKFGYMVQPNQFMEDYIKTTKTTQVFLTCHPVADAAILTISYRPIQKLMEQDEKQKARQGAKEGF